MIILTKTQADKVRGPTAAGAMLDPIEYQPGKFCLPESVLEDPAHQIHHEFLNGLPKQNVTFAGGE